VPDILERTRSEVEMHAIQTSGNCVRNVRPPTIWQASPLMSSRIRGRAANSSANGRRCHPEFTYLPRKFKIAVTGAPADRAAS
jgi:sulfite reductase (NADPH) hemoprotein beta-component